MGTLGGIPLDVGDVLARKYRLERLIGEGGTGVVVAATHLQLERLVAIKFLRTALASDEIRLRFEREARAIGQIESAHVVLVLDVGTLDDGHSPYMVMEYLEGRDLAKVLADDGPLSVQDAVDCALQVCEVLDRAHAQGIVHRDLKPANLFLTRRSEGELHIKVVDFGISKILHPKVLEGNPSEVTNAFTVLGSPRYMAPEQLRNSKDVDGRADLWSIGAVLFQLLTGKPAFDADNSINVSLAVLGNEPPLVRSLAAHVPEDLERVVSRCLTKDRNGRYQTASELADALRPFASEGTRESLSRLFTAAPATNPGTPFGGDGSGADLDGQRGAPTSPRLAVPLHPGSQPRSSPSEPPSSGDPNGAFSMAPRGAGSTRMKLVYAGGALMVVAFAFAMLTLLKLAAQSMGVLEAASSEPAAAPAAASSGLTGGGQFPEGMSPPSTAVTVKLDAGRAPP